eukprot:4012484-Alexandrium_andersonii.AAC.1
MCGLVPTSSGRDSGAAAARPRWASKRNRTPFPSDVSSMHRCSARSVSYTHLTLPTICSV